MDAITHTHTHTYTCQPHTHTHTYMYTHTYPPPRIHIVTDGVATEAAYLSYACDDSLNPCPGSLYCNNMGSCVHADSMDADSASHITNMRYSMKYESGQYDALYPVLNFSSINTTYYEIELAEGVIEVVLSVSSSSNSTVYFTPLWGRDQGANTSCLSDECTYNITVVGGVLSFPLEVR
jgi:hypothetical protein